MSTDNRAVTNGGKMSKLAEWYKGQEVMENHDSPQLHPAHENFVRFIKKNNYFFKFFSIIIAKLYMCIFVQVSYDILK